MNISPEIIADKLPESVRIQFRRLTLDDAEVWKGYFASAEAIKFMSLKLNDPDGPKIWIERQLKRYEDFGAGLWALINKQTGDFVGQCGLLVQEVGDETRLEIGYHLLPKHWRNGYATEAAMACRNFAFQNKLDENLISLIDPTNFRSQDVAKRNGMKFLEENVFRGDRIFVFGISREEWEGMKL
jgi:ribosomal-protein-alanine N-acetyltransferase